MILKLSMVKLKKFRLGNMTCHFFNLIYIRTYIPNNEVVKLLVLQAQEHKLKIIDPVFQSQFSFIDGKMISHYLLSKHKLPLARFYVQTEKNSFTLAKRLIQKTKINIKYD